MGNSVKMCSKQGADYVEDHREVLRMSQSQRSRQLKKKKLISKGLNPFQHKIETEDVKFAVNTA